MRRAAEETIGETKTGRNEEWFSERCKNSLEKRNQARLKLLQRYTRQNLEGYNAKRREAKRICREEKRNSINKRLENIENMNGEHNTRKFYKELDWFRKGYQPRINDCRSKTGELLESEKEVMDRWTEYFAELLNVDLVDVDSTEFDINNEEFFCQPQPLIEEPDKDDVLMAISDLKNCKAPGKDGLVAELKKTVLKKCRILYIS